MGEALRRLRPMSDGDAPEDENDNVDNDDNGVVAVGPTLPSDLRPRPHSRSHAPSAPNPTLDPNPDLDRDPDRWRRRMEHALVKLGLEVAAMREQLDAARRGDSPDIFSNNFSTTQGWFWLWLYGRNRRRKGRKSSSGNGILTWTTWLLGSILRHILIDATALVLVVLVSNAITTTAVAVRRRREGGDLDPKWVTSSPAVRKLLWIRGWWMEWFKSWIRIGRKRAIASRGEKGR